MKKHNYGNKNKGFIEAISWPSLKELTKVGMLVVGTIFVLALPLYAIDMVSGYVFNALKGIIWSVLDYFSY